MAIDRVPKDKRSTGRKRARATLRRVGRKYQCECEGCGSKTCGCVTGTSNETWDEANGTYRRICGYIPPVDQQSRSQTLDADHRNKNVLDNDPANLRWLCRPCHRSSDRATSKGVARDEVVAELYDSTMFEGLE